MKESPRILLKQFYEKSTFGFPPHSGSLNPLVKANISEWTEIKIKEYNND